MVDKLFRQLNLEQHLYLVEWPESSVNFNYTCNCDPEHWEKKDCETKPKDGKEAWRVRTRYYVHPGNIQE